MDLNRTLRELARLPETSLPVLSIYLNTRWDNEHQRERVRLFLQEKLKHARFMVEEVPGALESLEADTARITQYVEALVKQQVDVAYDGIALFACHGTGLWRIFRSSVPFENQFVVARRPALRQLCVLSDEYESALVVLVDSKSARIFEVALGGLIRELDLEAPDFPGRHKQGGWAQMRYQRHIKDHMDRHHKAVAEYLARLLEQRRNAHVLLNGQEEILANFTQHLPPWVRDRVIQHLSLDIRASDKAVLQQALEALREHEHVQENATVDRMIAMSMSGGLGALGINDTLDAVNRGAVHRLFLSRDFQEKGWQCTSCRALGHKVPVACPFCEGPVSTVDLEEAVVERVLAEDGSVETVNSHPRLRHYGGIGAILRFR